MSMGFKMYWKMTVSALGDSCRMLLRGDRMQAVGIEGPDHGGFPLDEHNAEAVSHPLCGVHGMVHPFQRGRVRVSVRVCVWIGVSVRMEPMPPNMKGENSSSLISPAAEESAEESWT